MAGEKERKAAINLADKPNLLNAMKDNPSLAKEVMLTFTELMEEAFDPNKGVTWAELPQKLNKDLTFSALVKGVLRGLMDLKGMNPELFDVLKEEVHPLSLLSPRKDYITGSLRVTNWRDYFHLPSDVKVDSETVSKIVGNIMRNARFINIAKLQQAHEVNQIATFRGLGDEQIKLLPFYPALRYQQKRFGDLHVGKYFDDVGFFDCGEMIEHTDNECPACNRPDLATTGVYKFCLYCNAGYKITDL